MVLLTDPHTVVLFQSHLYRGDTHVADVAFYSSLFKDAT